MFRLLTSRWIALVLPFLLAACGGGGSSNGTNADAQIAPRWHATSLSGDIDPDFRSQFGHWFVSDDGQVEANTTTNDNETVGAPEQSVGQFLPAADGSYVVQARLGQDDVDILRGFLAGNGQVGIHATARVIRGAQPSIGVIVRSGTGLATEDLIGDWHTVAVNLDPGRETMSSSRTSVSFEADNTITRIPWVYNVNGTVSNALGAPSTGYQVLADGAARVFSTPARHGGLSADREFMVVAGSDAAPAPATSTVGMNLYVRRSTAATDAAFSGRYGFVRLRRTEGGFEARSGLITSDGNGAAVRSAELLNREGDMLSILGTHLIDYSVTAEGRMTISINGEGTSYTGAVAPSGRYAILSGANTQGFPPCVWILVRLD